MRIDLLGRIWLGLLAGTALSWWLGERGLLHATGGRAWAVALFAVAVVKGLGVAWHFMELHHAPRLWQRLVLGWLLGVSAAIVVLWLLPPR